MFCGILGFLSLTRRQTYFLLGEEPKQGSTFLWPASSTMFWAPLLHTSRRKWSQREPQRIRTFLEFIMVNVLMKEESQWQEMQRRDPSALSWLQIIHTHKDPYVFLFCFVFLFFIFKYKVRNLYIKLWCSPKMVGLRWQLHEIVCVIC